jgi:hypothetical protein
MQAAVLAFNNQLAGTSVLDTLDCMYVCRLLHIGRIRMDIDNSGVPGT